MSTADAGGFAIKRMGFGSANCSAGGPARIASGRKLGDTVPGYCAYDVVRVNWPRGSYLLVWAGVVQW